MTDTDKILLTHNGAASTIVLNRPAKLNALDHDMIERLVRICQEVELRDETRAVILTGAGQKAFCAGGDIADWSGYSPYEFGRQWIRFGHHAFDRLARLRHPVIAVLNGHVLGGGLELAACADIRIGESHVRIGQPETGIGIIPGWSGTQRTTRRFGGQVIRRMALLGEMFSAEESLRMGLIDHLVVPGEGMAKADRMVKHLGNRSQLSGELVKMLINSAEGEQAGSDAEAIAGMLAAGSTDLQEGLMAFREKRHPHFPTRTQENSN